MEHRTNNMDEQMFVDVVVLGILRKGMKRLRGKINYSEIVFHMMPSKFTISQLQEVYELNKRETKQ